MNGSTVRRRLADLPAGERLVMFIVLSLVILLVSATVSAILTPGPAAGTNSPQDAGGLVAQDVNAASCVGAAETVTPGATAVAVALQCSVPLVTPSTSTSSTPAPSTTTVTTPAPTVTTTTTTPSPSTTTSASGACLPKPSACGLPDATNTGVPAGTALTASGGLTVRTAGAVVSGLDIAGCVSVQAPNVTIRNSRIRCGGPYGIRPAYGTSTATQGLVVENVEIDCLRGSGTGIAGAYFTLRRASIHGCVNGVAADQAVTVENSFLWGFVDNDGSKDGPHTDGIQVASNVSGLTVHGNTILNYGASPTSAIINSTSGMSNVLIAGNLLDGGAYTLYCPRAASTNYRVTDNRFGHRATYGPTDSCRTPNVTAFTGNRWDDAGALL